MSETQPHQGFKLKKIIENSRFTVREISENSGIALSSLYDMYKKPELLRSKIEPILKMLEIDADVFFGIKTVAAEDNAPYGLKAINEAQQREIELLKNQLAAKEEIIELLKQSKTKTGKK